MASGLGGGDLGLGAVGDAGELRRQAGRQGRFDPAQALGAVLAAQLEDEGRVGAGLGGDRAGGEGRGVGGGGLRGRALSAAGGEGGLEGAFGVGVGAFGGGPGDQVGGGGVGGADRRGDQAPAGAAEEVQADVFERQLGVFFKAVGELAGDRVGFDLAGELGEDPGLGVFDGEVDRQQGAEGVVEGLGEVEGAVQGLGVWGRRFRDRLPVCCRFRCIGRAGAR